ncbi:unnamed protein product [Staurois parvus]|uniref:Uncharacterized protein n=1 Tax=Staurois parvus TaxID=386267 RepID=A0ABN9DU03_9NEOB|nr:unnamed protein product [Staurois parvus]
MWPTTSWLSCCCFQLLPLCYNTTNSSQWNMYLIARKFHGWNYCTGGNLSQYHV